MQEEAFALLDAMNVEDLIAVQKRMTEKLEKETTRRAEEHNFVRGELKALHEECAQLKKSMREQQDQFRLQLNSKDEELYEETVSHVREYGELEDALDTEQEKNRTIQKTFDTLYESLNVSFSDLKRVYEEKRAEFQEGKDGEFQPCHKKQRVSTQRDHYTRSKSKH